MNNFASKSKHFMLLGQCLPSLKKNASKIRVRRMELDTNLNMVIFFKLNYSIFNYRDVASLVFQKG